jgi:general secretion pathway protein D
MIKQAKHTSVLFFIFILSTLQLMPSMSIGQTIAEKKASLVSGGTGDLSREMQKFLLQVNTELREQSEILRVLYEDVRILYRDGAPPEEYQKLLEEINQVKSNIVILQKSWQEMASENNREEEYALWHQPDTTLGDLIIDFGSQDYVYLMDPEIEDIPLSVNSNIPIPRSSWTEMLELILQENGVGIKQLNPFLRQLILLEDDNSNIRLVTNIRSDLDIYPDDARICYVISPNPAEVRQVWFFLEKFANPNSSELERIGRDILVIAPVKEVRELLRLYDFVEANKGDLEYQVVALRRVKAEEMANILTTIFDHGDDDYGNQSMNGVGKSTSENRGGNGLRVIPMANGTQALFLVGTPKEVNEAEEIINQVESQVGEATERVVYTYVCKHTDTVELADILNKVYGMMARTGAGAERPSTQEPYPEDEKTQNVGVDTNVENVATTDLTLDSNLLSANEVLNPGYYSDGSYVINSDLIQPGSSEQGNPEPNKGRDNFIVDVKTGTIVMVVETYFLPKLKELIKKLDIPKKMVMIEVLLFEKQIEKDSSFGLNLLRLGDKASNADISALSFNNINPVGGSGPVIGNRGILEFCLSRACTATIGAYDIAYRFLLSRDDVTINSNPSVVAINQTTAEINILEQISVNTGTLLIDTTGGAIPNNQFVREEYGITIKMTPTIHMRDEEDDEWAADDTNYVTLETDITFDTIKPSDVNRPDVIRRHVVNEVRIADGQTVIIGGLRRKESKDFKEQIPFLGELPGIGKLFSDTRSVDSSREMFIFITPTIISDPSEDMIRIRSQQMCRRPGDIPAFMVRLDRARECEKKRLFEGYIDLILGRPPAPAYFPPGEYDGRCR